MVYHDEQFAAASEYPLSKGKKYIIAKNNPTINQTLSKLVFKMHLTRLEG